MLKNKSETPWFEIFKAKSETPWPKMFKKIGNPLV